MTLKDGKTYTWAIETGYAATVTDAREATTYLLHPRLAAGPADPAAGSPRGPVAQSSPAPRAVLFAGGNHGKELDKHDADNRITKRKSVPTEAGIHSAGAVSQRQRTAPCHVFSLRPRGSSLSGS